MGLGYSNRDPELSLQEPREFEADRSSLREGSGVDGTVSITDPDPSHFNGLSSREFYLPGDKTLPFRQGFTGASLTCRCVHRAIEPGEFCHSRRGSG